MGVCEHQDGQPHLPAIRPFQPGAIGHAMHAIRLLAMVAVLVLSGCAGKDASFAPSNDGNQGTFGSQDAGDKVRTSPGTEAEAAATDKSRTRLAYRDCFFLLGFVPMDWASAQALMPTGFVPITWTIDEDPTDSLAILQVYFVECQQVSLDGEELGQVASVWLHPDTDSSSAALLDQNNFYGFSAHSSQKVVDYWATVGAAELAAMALMGDVPGRAAAVTIDGPGLAGSITFHEGDVFSGVGTATWRVFHDAGHLDMVQTQVRGTFLGGLDLALTRTPFPVNPGLPAGGSTGFGNGHGAMAELLFEEP